MKWFQPIECDKTVKNPLVCDTDNLNDYGFDEHSFIKGKEIDNWNDSIFLRSSKKKYDGTPDDVVQNGSMIPVFSERLVDELNKEGICGVQYLPIRIFNSKNESYNGFYIANFINFIEAFNYEKSIFNRFSEDFPNPNVRGEIAGVMKFVLDKDRLEGLDVIRLKEYKRRFFVSEKFKMIFDKNKFSGYSFREVELS